MKKKLIYIIATVVLTLGAGTFQSTYAAGDDALSSDRKIEKSHNNKIDKLTKKKIAYVSVSYSYYCPGLGEVFWGTTYFYRDQYANDEQYQAAIDRFVSEVNETMDYLDTICY